MAGPGGMKATDLNGVKVCTVSGQRSIASWVNPTKLRSLRKDEGHHNVDDYMQRMELLQDLQFDTASTRMKVTPDGLFLVASGTYPSQVKVYELKELTLKFERHLISDIVNFQFNEIAWNTTGELFFLTTGNGTVEVLAYPSLQTLHTLVAHTSGCYCIAIDPIGRYFVVGSADALVSPWDVSEMLCARTCTKLEWPVRTISFNYDGQYIASASEDLFIDISEVESRRSFHQIWCREAVNSAEWNPKYNLLAFAADDKNKYRADEGVFRVFGFETVSVPKSLTVSFDLIHFRISLPIGT